MSLVTTKVSGDKNIVEINIKELTLRLKSLENGCNIEIVQLAISSMLEEIEEAVKQASK